MLADAVGSLNFSAAAEADRNLSCFHNHRHLAPAVRMFEHTFETFVVFENIDVLERYLTAGKVLTGSRRIRSKIFTEN